MAASQRSRILDAMRRAVVSEGYAGASLSAITTLAGVSRKTFYVHFANKEECFLTVYRDARARLFPLLQHARDQPGPWPARTVALVSAALEALAADPDAARLVFVEVIAAGEQARALRNEHVVAFTRAFEPTPADRRELGLTPATDDGAAEVVVGGINELVFREIVEGRTSGLPHLLPDVAFVAISSYLGGPAARSVVAELVGG